MLARFAAAAAAAAALLIGGTGSAGATTAGPVTTTPHGTWGAYLSGRDPSENYATVYSVVRTADHIYLAGKFASLVGPNGEMVPARNLAALHADGTPDTSFNVSTDGVVRRLTRGPGGNLYVGGAFTHLKQTDPVTGTVTSYYRPHLGRIDLPTATSPVVSVDAGWHPSVVGTNATVYAIGFGPAPVAGARTVYVGGHFADARGSGDRTGTPRDNAAGFTADTGALLPWAPTADNGNYTDPHGPSVRDVLVQTDNLGNTTTYLAGEFDVVDGVTRFGVARVSADTGSVVTAFSPNRSTDRVRFSSSNDGFQLTFGHLGSAAALWMAGGGQANGLFALDPTTGTRLRKVRSDGDVQTLTLQGDYVYVGGHMLTFGGQNHVHTARVDMTSGLVDAAWAPSMSPQYSPYYYGVWSVVRYTAIDPSTGAETNYLYEAGAFKYVAQGRTGPKFAWFQSDPLLPSAQHGRR